MCKCKDWGSTAWERISHLLLSQLQADIKPVYSRNAGLGQQACSVLSQDAIKGSVMQNRAQCVSALQVASQQHEMQNSSMPPITASDALLAAVPEQCQAHQMASEAEWGLSQHLLA